MNGFVVKYLIFVFTKETDSVEKERSMKSCESTRKGREGVIYHVST